MNFQACWSIATKEFFDRIRNKWVLAVTLVFLVFSFIISYFGLAFQGSIGISNIEATITSLVSLVIYLLPLIALILGYDAIVGEKENATLELLLSMPITKLDILLGKFLGLSLALIVPIVFGFGIMGLTLSFQLPISALFHYMGFIISAILLGMVFLSIAIMVSVLAADRAQASGITIALWFFFVLIFDILLLGILILGKGQFGGEYFAYSFLLNPVDIFRILNIFSHHDVEVMFGLSSIFPTTLANPYILSSFMLAWIICPLIISHWRLIK